MIKWIPLCNLLIKSIYYTPIKAVNKQNIILKKVKYVKNALVADYRREVNKIVESGKLNTGITTLSRSVS